MSLSFNNIFRVPSVFIAPVLLLAVLLNTYSIDFPDWYHIDEPKKFRFVKSMENDFHHPLLMLQLGRFLNGMLLPDKPVHFAVMCRLISVLSGMLAVAVFFVICRKDQGLWPSLTASLGLAVCPIMVVHAHYFKEDILFTCCALLTVFALSRFFREQKPSRALQLGFVLGLATAAQYKGVLLGLLILIAPLAASGLRAGRYYRNVPIVVLAALAVFLVVNYPLFIEPANFFEGLAFEARHAVEGHDVYIGPMAHLFSFHLIHSIAPGISWPLTITALAGFLWMAFKWRRLTFLDRVFFLYFLLFYAAHEASPLKSYPDFARYILPAVPALFYFVAFLLRELMAAGGRLVVPALSVSAVLLLITFTLVDSCKLVYYLNKDTREQAAALVRDSGTKPFSERYGMKKYNIRVLADVDLSEAKAEGFDVLVASSFTYDRFFLQDGQEGRRASYGLRKARYEALFSLPHREIRPAHRSYAYSNPVIRVIDISSETGRITPRTRNGNGPMGPAVSAGLSTDALDPIELRKLRDRCAPFQETHRHLDSKWPPFPADMPPQPS